MINRFASANKQKGRLSPATTFAVVDVETTGLYANSHDKIVEIAIVQMDERGSILDEYATLLNPERDIGTTHIHGITASEVANAPLFAEIAGDIGERLKSSILVAHNARFDLGFLESEFCKMDFQLPETCTLCTMRLARQFGRLLSRYRLADCCSHFGISHGAAHSSLGDAKAVAGLLTIFVKHAGGLERLLNLAGTTFSAQPHLWPAWPVNGKVWSRHDAATARANPTFLSKLVHSLPDTGIHSETDFLEYIDLLDRALEDRQITEQEAEMLFDTATHWGLSVTDVRKIHREYLNSLVTAALSDEVITKSEHRDLNAVTSLLGLKNTELESTIQEANVTKNKGSELGLLSSQPSLVGLSVCFTGQLVCKINGRLVTRDRSIELATEAGMTVMKNVTKKLDILVVADPATMSSKAQKARKCGTRIMAEAVFWRTLGIDVE